MRTLFHSRVFLSIAAAAVAVGAVVGIGIVLRDSDDATTSPDELVRPSFLVAVELGPEVFAPPPLVQPPAATLPPVGEGIGPGDTGPVVQAYEQRLADLKFDPGAVDGVYDRATEYAVEAVQKSLGGELTGRIGGDTGFAISVYNYTPALEPNGGPNRTELDITRQIITLYENWQVRLITVTSTGSGERYCYNSPRVNPTVRICEAANTPSGRYEFYEYRDGWDKSPLGQLYNPYYFHGGIAVHGYESVPSAPESHGCARIPMHIAEYFHTLVHDGHPVYVFGGQDAIIYSRSPISSAPAAPPPPAPPAPAPPAPAPPAPAPPAPPPPAPPGESPT